ncbi:MAG: Mut7-C ubiquitin/RNAse domain-containing protein [Hydrococcus sp. C42_A2020_068]|uniref:Mut7-C RNAse domain-containing protein n=1 Tax=Pleurocapsa sp. PCC 7327 TaxID=118163 RepID=UPI00029FB0CD|nr:Mut7-C RNAse domain-containing protein [Pleurocapsa sp. PCC 7327]AFY75566.1 hypothetical protein Ple7327_0079 [Pleurocapsa sp. PCC 7327]MBF2022057.1 Mut7-C ubiquitin/RNAse domain-containing protein [Hydrococcus sp. C42_A2020_068]
MARAIFCFQAELNHFLPPHRKGVSFTHEFKERPSIKDTIEALGVPHPEVYAIVANGVAVDFSYSLQDGDRITVYPISASPKIPSGIRLQPPLPEVARFVLDVHLGKLASLLRMLGFDTLYRNDYEDAELAQISALEDRILLTRDKGVLMRSLVTYGYYVRETNPEKQVVEVLRHFNLFDAIKPFQRCMRCNGNIKPIDKASIVDLVPSRISREIEEFHCCTGCSQIYWQGSHFQRMERAIERLISSASLS